MPTRHGKLYFEGPLSLRTRHPKVNLAGLLLKFGNTIIGLFRKAIGENWTRKLRNDAFYTRIVNTKNGKPVKGKL